VDLAVCLAYGLDGSRRLKPWMGGCGIGYVTVNLLMAMIRDQTKLLKTVNCGSNADVYLFFCWCYWNACPLFKNIDGPTIIKGSFALPVGLHKQNVSGYYLM